MRTAHAARLTLAILQYICRTYALLSYCTLPVCALLALDAFCTTLRDQMRST